MPKGSKIKQCWLDYVKNALRKKNDKHFNCLLKMLTVLQQQILVGRHFQTMEQQQRRIARPVQPASADWREQMMGWRWRKSARIWLRLWKWWVEVQLTVYPLPRWQPVQCSSNNNNNYYNDYHNNNTDHNYNGCRPVSPPHHLCPHSGDSWRHFFSSDNGVNNTNYCVVVLKCLALSTTLILANWTELN